MPQSNANLLPIRSARPAVTQEVVARTGLDEAVLTALVHGFYGKVRVDPVLGPIFAARIVDWGPHLEKMVDFWSSVALMTGRYHGTPVPKHAELPVTWEHFERWLELFRQAASEVCSPEGAAHVIERAERIARSLHTASQTVRQLDGDVPNLK
ncbi:hemoglobin [Poseidonocella pacifica]|uniref:Hemoglobin n=1 Tax=Poseidonocella pacifica TaxID=871651 RepID=A0A1I0UXW3_9RHOB|nr:group III truncated hemoglobin [Poseidonocella pacifica]SFA68733.1 hemoglobin [Poseidonocella pacifica]